MLNRTILRIFLSAFVLVFVSFTVVPSSFEQGIIGVLRLNWLGGVHSLSRVCDGVTLVMMGHTVLFLT